MADTSPKRDAVECEYCSRRGISSSAVGRCAGCGTAVCDQDTGRQPDHYHADQCSFGCEGVICVHGMDGHAFEKHGSTVDACFPNSAVHAALLAGAVLEQPDATSDTFVSAVGRYATIVRPPLRDIPLDWWLNIDFGELAEWVRPELAASLVPSIFDTLVKAWPLVTNKRLREQLGQKLVRRLDILAFSRATWNRPRTRRATVLDTWFRFSPRLVLLRLKYDADPNSFVFDTDGMVETPDLSPAVRNAVYSGLDWSAAPAGLVDDPNFGPKVSAGFERFATIGSD